jgi:protein-tyrosine kinase
MTDLIQKNANTALSTDEFTALQSLAMLPLQQIPARIRLTLPFERLATLLRSVKFNLAQGQAAAPETPVIHFVSPHRDDGADVIAFETAYIASTQPGKRVLFINTSTHSQFVADRMEYSVLPNDNKPDENVAYPSFTGAGGETNFFFTTVSAPGNEERILPDVRDFRKIIEDLRKMFDLVVIHSDLALTGHMANTLYGLTDGCVIIAQAEHTRMPVIRKLRNVIERQGGRIVGVVLNKRKYYIPRKLYSFLFSAAE